MKELLPLGTVITLKQGKKRLMIVGRLQNQVGTEKIYDYAAVLWPEGVLDSTHFYLFNDEDIQTLYFIGLQDTEEFNYRYVLEEQQKNNGK
ncbi:MAG: DUF4176 domain-containing protein [Absicoccus sp.]|uniref:DUF4176 domain-containing protein n=1 Tax=Absicoccus intestinalis TaxID=2926319 RepID=A0ABU4WRX5_9FIRM|nr:MULTISPECIES: DUF4176 domain-containing protein [unclassified Absicoccus]MDX8418212.1 DUF4176 domain-containing protein [Absicoccus sp. CLA-KB-P134]MDY3035911.1 DUF4176 domain-containing protein [Absicoccus sp.]